MPAPMVAFRHASDFTRARLAQRLIPSLDRGADTDVERLWLVEAERRLAEFKSGKAAAIPAERVITADEACNRITAAITAAFASERPIKAVLDAYNPAGSTSHVRFNTSRAHRWETSAERSCAAWSSPTPA